MRKRKGGLVKKTEDFFLSDFMLGVMLTVAVFYNILAGYGIIG